MFQLYLHSSTTTYTSASAVFSWYSVHPAEEEGRRSTGIFGARSKVLGQRLSLKGNSPGPLVLIPERHSPTRVTAEGLQIVCFFLFHVEMTTYKIIWDKANHYSSLQLKRLVSQDASQVGIRLRSLCRLPSMPGRQNVVIVTVASWPAPLPYLTRDFPHSWQGPLTQL